MISEKLRAEFLARRCSETAPVVRTWISPEEIESAHSESLDANVARLTDRGFSAGFAARCPIPGASEEDYLYKLTETPIGHVVSSIRFKGLDVAKPFVEIEERSFALTDENLRWLIPVLERQHAIFAPGWIRFTESVRGRSPSSIDNYVVAGPTSLEFGKAVKTIELVPTQTTEWYSSYLDAYASLKFTAPHLHGRVPIESEESLAEIASKGALFIIRVRGAWAGVFGVIPSTMEGLRGWLVAEEVLAERYRGRGLAREAQSQFLRTGLAKSRPIIFGEILADNTPSLRTAAAVGRVPVAQRSCTSPETK